MKTFFHWLAVLLAIVAILQPAPPVAAAPVFPVAAQSDPLHMGDPVLLGGGGLPLLYQFTGVVDDGARTVNGKVATSITCTNMNGTAAQVAVYIYGSDALTTYYSVTITIPAWRTHTFSTQYTNLYYEAAVFQAAPGDNGTSAIRQGMGSVFSDSSSVICTAQVLDPTGFPPAFATRLTLHNAIGLIARNVQRSFLPAISR